MAFDKDKVVLNQNLAKMFRLIENDSSVMKLVVDNNVDCLSGDKPNIKRPKDYRYVNMFPYRFIPEKKDEVKTYLNFAFVGNKAMNGSIQTNQISFFILTHYDIVRISEGSRLFTLMEAVRHLFDNNEEFKTGKWELTDTHEIVGMVNYTGYQMDFTYRDIKKR